MLGGPEPVTALFAGNNRITVTAVRVLYDRPADQAVALVGFDDFELADVLRPGVTVVAQDPALLGLTAARLLFRRLDGAAGDPARVGLPCRLVPRGSGELPPRG
jgi:LacI family transcriptional regulator